MTIKYPYFELLSSWINLVELSEKMRQKKGFSRLDILSLDVKTLRDTIHPGKHVELAISENGVDDPQLDRSLKSWILSTPYQISFSRNKIGKPLLKPHRNGFLLDDPNMRQTRFFVEYHRLQDPSLKKYFSRSSIRNRLKELNMITEDDDAVCTKKEFAEYLRYLQIVRSLSVTDAIKAKVCAFVYFQRHF